MCICVCLRVFFMSIVFKIVKSISYSLNYKIRVFSLIKSKGNFRSRKGLVILEDIERNDDLRCDFLG